MCLTTAISTSRPAPAPAWPARPRADRGRRRGHRDPAPTVGPGQLAYLVWAAPADLAAWHAQLFQAAIRAYEDGRAEAAERFWLQARTLWSQTWAANCAAFGLVQYAGVTRVL